MKALRIFTALLLIFFVLNYWSRKLLPFAYADVADYSLLYTTGNSVYIKKLEVVDDSLEILFNRAVSTDAGTLKGNTLRYKPPAGKPQVVSINNSGKSYSLHVSYTPGGSSLPFEVTSADIPIEPAVVRDISDWPPDDWEKDKRVDFKKLSEFVTDSSGITDGDNTVQRILKIGRLVLAGMPADSGKHDARLSALHPMQQYQLAKKGNANLWCGNYAAIFSSFAMSVGTPVRTVFTGTSKNELGLGNHVFCEAYIKEEDCWAYVDLTSNTVLLKNGDSFLNVVDVQRLLRYSGGTDKVSSYSVMGDSVQIVPFDSMSKYARYYFTPNAFFTFFYRDYFSKYPGAGVIQRIKNMFITRPTYAVYSDNLPGRNYHFLARIISNYFLAAMALLWLISLAAYLYFRKKK